MLPAPKQRAVYLPALTTRRNEIECAKKPFAEEENGSGTKTRSALSTNNSRLRRRAGFKYHHIVHNHGVHSHGQVIVLLNRRGFHTSVVEKVKKNR